MLIPTPRLLLIALSALVVMPLTGSPGAALIVGMLWLAATVVLALVDAWFVPGRDQLVWNREHDAKLSLGAWNRIKLCLQNRAARPITLRVRDAVPAWLTPRGEAAEGSCASGGTWSYVYHVFPLHRGDYAFGPITARYQGPLGLVWRQYGTQLDDHVKVYPNLLAIREYETLARRGRLEEMGLRVSRRWGAGTEFERLRDYTTDDEYRRINWPATARRHKPIAVDYQTERSQNVMLVLDVGRLMSTELFYETKPFHDASAVPTVNEIHGSQALTRLDYSLNAALLLAFVSQQYGDRVGLLAFSDRVARYVAPAPGRHQFLRLTEALYNLEAEPTEADYATGLGYLALRNPRRSLVIVFTDVMEPDSATVLLAQLGHLARRHLPLVVTLRDPGIERLATQPPEDSRSVYERAVARTVLDDREETLRHLRRSGALTLDTSADQLSPALINRYLEIKARSAL